MYLNQPPFVQLCNKVKLKWQLLTIWSELYLIKRKTKLVTCSQNQQQKPSGIVSRSILVRLLLYIIDYPLFITSSVWMRRLYNRSKILLNTTLSIPIYLKQIQSIQFCFVGIFPGHTQWTTTTISCLSNCERRAGSLARPLQISNLHRPGPGL